MKGHVRQRGTKSWELKFDAGRDPAMGRRKIQYHSFKGTKREAQVKLAELIASVGQGSYVEPSKVTVAEHVRARVDQWEAKGEITARTAQRYRQLTENQIVPHLGDKPIQKLKRMDIEMWHTALRSDVAARTIGIAHRVLSKALSEAEKDGLAPRNVCKIESAPRVESTEMRVLKEKEIATVISRLHGRTMHAPVIVALYTGMRLGEILALRWINIDLDKKMIQVREALEETKAHGIRFKTPKTKAGRRDITLPDIVVDALHAHRRQQLELRLQLGLGRLDDDALVFPTIEGKPQSPINVSRAWGHLADEINFPEITFHSLRHTHVSQLIDVNVDLVTISRRLGHASPEVTLRIYAHLFRQDDSKAADAINKALGQS